MPDPYRPTPWKSDPRNHRAGQIVEPVPKGSIARVLAWVGDDVDRAERALDVELAGANRVTLVDRLDMIISGDDAEDLQGDDEAVDE